MTTYIVTRVRKEPSRDGTHQHIAGVCTTTAYYTRQQVIESISVGNTWVTQAGGIQAVIRIAGSCRRPGCAVSPYIKTNPDSSKFDNLENLPLC
ncbi:MAG: DUF3892 domain-containing protein [Candidatus Nanopelagicales bacterium]